MESGLLVYKLIWENLEDEGKVKLFHFYYPRDLRKSGFLMMESMVSFEDCASDYY